MNWNLFLTIVNVLVAASLGGLAWFRVIKKQIVRDASIDASLKELCGFKEKTDQDLKTHQQAISQNAHLISKNTTRIVKLEETNSQTI